MSGEGEIVSGEAGAVETRAERQTRGLYKARVAVIVPVYGHSILMCDALDSVLAQPDEPSVLGIIVNDGCKYPETHWTALEYATAHPDRFVYLEQPNQGLSAARNTGIEWALENIEGLEAVYLLDADNILVEGGIRQALETMEKTGADWVYPPYTATGVYRVVEQVEPYSRSKLLRFNYIDAGSLIHRRMLDESLRFDRAMNKGYEDWDFWLHAMENGFRGEYDRDLGLLYRKRPESMLSDSDLMKGDLVAAIRSKYKASYHPVPQALAAAEERPRYAVLMTNSARVITTSFVGEAAARVAREDIEKALWRAIIRADDHDIPAYYVWVESGAWDCLQRLKVLPWLLVDAERALRQSPIYGVRLEADATDGELTVKWGGAPRQASMIVMRSDTVQSVCKDVSTSWLESSVLSEQPVQWVPMRTVHIPRRERSSVRRIGMSILDDFNEFQKSPFRASTSIRWHWKPGVPVPSDERYAVFSEPYTKAAPLPCKPTGKDVVMLMTYAQFGGADRVGYNVAHALRAHGYTPHLVVTGGEHLYVRLPTDFADTFASISFLDEPRAGQWGGNGFYFGTGLSGWGADDSFLKLWELVWHCNVYINNHSVAANAIIGRLKQHKVATFTYQHLVDIDALGQPTGHPILALAYESSYTGVLGCSQAICDWLVAEGTPREKVTEIRNGPGFIVTPERAEAIMEARARNDGSGPLRVLYLGRLDRQKGVNALMEVHRRSLTEKLPVTWRIVGDSMVETGPMMSKEFAEAREPAVFDAEDVLATLAWADVIVLMSDYEGLPLVLIEAMLCGAVPISTNVGAIEELITDGQDGFLLDPPRRAQQALDRLRQLAGDRALLATMSRAAHQAGAARNDWAGSVQPLIEMIERAGAPI
ncbi:MAG: glycosyltransferase [Hyphomicrobiaceae bacterium]